jgi:hypothetical protein
MPLFLHLFKLSVYECDCARIHMTVNKDGNLKIPKLSLWLCAFFGGRKGRVSG